MAPTDILSEDDRMSWQDRIVRDAVAAERERCALIAENYTEIPCPDDVSWGDDPDEVAAKLIAAKIRSGQL